MTIESLYKQTATTTLYSDLNRNKPIEVKYYKPDISDYGVILNYITTGLKPLYLTKKQLDTLKPFEISTICLEKFDQVMSSNNNDDITELLTALFVFNEKGIDYLKNIIKSIYFELDTNRITFTVLVNCMIMILQEGSTNSN